MPRCPVTVMLRTAAFGRPSRARQMPAPGREPRFTMCALSGRWANRARAGNGGLQAKSRIHTIGHLRPFMPQKTRVGNDRSQSTTDVARRRNRNEKLYKAGARSSVTLARKTLIEGPLFQKANWRYRP